jgi:Protein of unknown function (DUF2599)
LVIPVVTHTPDTTDPNSTNKSDENVVIIAPRYDYDTNKERNGNRYTGPVIGNNSGYFRNTNLISNDHKCERYVDRVQWVYRKIYGGYNWSLNIIPSQCSKELANRPTPWESWEEVVTKTPLCTESLPGNPCIVQWDKKWNTSQYWSMYNQYVCHTDFATILGKDEYNIEPWRSDMGYNNFAFNGCNDEPVSDFLKNKIKAEIDKILK